MEDREDDLAGSIFVCFDDHEQWQWVFPDNFPKLAAVEVVEIQRRAGQPLGLGCDREMYVAVADGSPASAAGVQRGWRVRWPLAGG